MNKAELLSALDKAGETLADFGETYITLSCRRDDDGSITFGVGVMSAAAKFAPDTFGHADNPTAAFAKACSKRTDVDAEHNREAELRAEFEAFKARRIAA